MMKLEMKLINESFFYYLYQILDTNKKKFFLEFNIKKINYAGAGLVGNGC